MFGYKTFVKIYLILPEILSVINSRESGFSRILKSEGAIGCQTLVEQSKTRNEHGSGTQIELGRQNELAASKSYVFSHLLFQTL
jgi:hypothetical protein